MIIEPEVYSDNRGFFLEVFHQKRYVLAGVGSVFVQDNMSFSIQGTLRGLHYQYPDAQAKLVNVVEGEIFDVVVDIRRGSPNFGQWFGTRLSDNNRRQMYIPEGFAHGFCVISERAYVNYKCSDFYSPENERGILWSDPNLYIDWPVKTPLLSAKDNQNPLLQEVSPEHLPSYRGPSII